MSVQTAQRRGRARRATSAGVVAAVGAIVAALLIARGFLGGGGGHATASVRPQAPVPLPAQSAKPAGTPSAADARRRAATLVPDPQEASSFPVTAQAAAGHSTAVTPGAAALQAGVSPGAPSDAQVRALVQQMQHVQQSEASGVAPGAISPASGALGVPAGLPQVIARVIAGGNAIADFPYVYGGGHASFVDTAYDCSGSVSYALAAGGMLAAPETSGQLESWGAPGPGRWITVYANAGHTFMNVAGVWFNTAHRTGPYSSRWMYTKPTLDGFVVRHWPGL